jgi:hypothetical protein
MAFRAKKKLTAMAFFLGDLLLKSDLRLEALPK